MLQAITALGKEHKGEESAEAGDKEVKKSEILIWSTRGWGKLGTFIISSKYKNRSIVGSNSPVQSEIFTEIIIETELHNCS